MPRSIVGLSDSSRDAARGRRSATFGLRASLRGTAWRVPMSDTAVIVSGVGRGASDDGGGGHRPGAGGRGRGAARAVGRRGPSSAGLDTRYLTDPKVKPGWKLQMQYDRLKGQRAGSGY
jgi:hypothetical protein